MGSAFYIFQKEAFKGYFANDDHSCNIKYSLGQPLTHVEEAQCNNATIIHYGTDKIVMKTEGHYYQTDSEFFNACSTSSTDRELSVKKILCRVYQIGQLRTLASNLAFSIVNFEKSNKEAGVKKTYALASLLSKNIPKKSLAEGLQDLEHSLYFPIVSYFKLPNAEEVKSSKEYINFLQHNGFKLNSGNCFLFNGIITPEGRYPKLEVIKKIPGENIVSMIFSCNRVQFSPINKSFSYENSFLCRIPIVVRFMFDYNIIEVNMPYYYEHFGHKMNGEDKYPKRIQEIFQNINVSVNKLLPRSARGLDYSNLTFHLEDKCDAIDMGWQIEPQDSAKFDAKQNALPLKEIFGDFETELKKECTAMDIGYPFEICDLYSIFRAIKERGHTLQFNLDMKVGRKGGRLGLFLIYGAKNSGYPPIIRLKKSSPEILKKIREEIYNTSRIPKYKNKYELYSLLTNKS